jgi:hypothetical protein
MKPMTQIYLYDTKYRFFFFLKGKPVILWNALVSALHNKILAMILHKNSDTVTIILQLYICFLLPS